MNCVLLTHPAFLEHQSMPRFARMLADGMKKRGHHVEIWSPQPKFVKLSKIPSLKKWLGYVDQYVVFPQGIRRKLKACPPDTIFVATDQALGPWVPAIAHRHHVIHCHDFMALRSALGEITQNPTGWTGKLYQKFIRRGFSRGKYFISVSQNTQKDLHRFLLSTPLLSEVVYNGLNASFSPGNPQDARDLLSQKTNLPLTLGYILHVGGNQWYKNRAGIIELYDSWRSGGGKSIPLLLIGEPPTPQLVALKSRSLFKSQIHFLSDIDDSLVKVAYNGAVVFLFPSLAEGFGWPIAEAMASGCPVITTNEAPMTEVAGEAAFLIPARPHEESLSKTWASEAAKTLEQVVGLTADVRSTVIARGLENSKRFDTELALDKIEAIYQRVYNSDS